VVEEEVLVTMIVIATVTEIARESESARGNATVIGSVRENVRGIETVIVIEIGIEIVEVVVVIVNEITAKDKKN
jgi:hypothetical protein